MNSTMTIEPQGKDVVKQAVSAIKALECALPEPARHAAEPARLVKIEANLPESALLMLLETLKHIVRGNAVVLASKHAEMTTQEAADYLNVSRPYLIELLKAGKIPFRLVGRHRRIYFSDLVKYRRADHAARQRILDELAKETQAMDVEY